MTDAAIYRDAERRYWDLVGETPSEEWHDLRRTQARVRVQVVGEGPPVVFLHGANTSGTVWAPLAARLGGFRRLLLDRPGCGLSEPLRSRVDDVETFATFAGDLTIDLLDSLGLERAHLVSTSFGGYHALHAAAAHPERVAGVIQLGWTVGAPNGRLPLLMRIGGSRRLGRLMARMRTPRAAIRPMLARIGLRQAIDAGRVPDEMVDWFHALLRRTDTMRNELDGSPPIIHPLRGMNEAILLPDHLLGGIRVPVCFVWGDGDPFGGTEVATSFAAKVPGSRLVVMPNAGHAVWVDDPERVAALTRDALGRTTDDSSLSRPAADRPSPVRPRGPSPRPGGPGWQR